MDLQNVKVQTLELLSNAALIREDIHNIVTNNREEKIAKNKIIEEYETALAACLILDDMVDGLIECDTKEDIEFLVD